MSATAPPSDLGTLEELGFKRLTQWVTRGDRVKPQDLDWAEVAGWIYAFVKNGKVRYVGIATTVLRSRLDGYSYQINDRVCGLIRQALNDGEAVEIYGLERGDVSKPDLEREESGLIRDFKADWNVRA